jgi:hypothetical protein
MQYRVNKSRVRHKQSKRPATPTETRSLHMPLLVVSPMASIGVGLWLRLQSHLLCN